MCGPWAHCTRLSDVRHGTRPGAHTAATASQPPRTRMTSLIVAPVVTTSSTTTTPAPGGAPASARMDPARAPRRAGLARLGARAQCQAHAVHRAGAPARPQGGQRGGDPRRQGRGHGTGAQPPPPRGRRRDHPDLVPGGGIPLAVEAPGQRGAQALAAFGQEGAQIAPRRVLRRQDQAAKRPLVGSERAQVDAARRARGLQDAPDALPAGQRPALRAQVHVPRPAARARGGQCDVGAAAGERAQEPADRRHGYPA